jgi:cell wall-associated NlpC family hydrolase
MAAVARRRRIYAFAAASLLLVSLGTLPGTAHADEISDKKAQAAALAAKIDKLGATIEQYAEQANAAQLELDDLTQQVADSEAKVQAAQAERDQHRSEIRNYAVRAYVTGGDNPAAAATASGSGDAGDVGQRQSYLSAAAGNRQQLVDELRSTEHDLQTQISQLNEAKGQAEAKTNDLNSKKASAESASNELEQLKSQTDAEVNRLVAAEQARKAAEEPARAEARAAARASQQAASRPASTRSGGGSSSGGSVDPGPAPSSNHDVGAVIAAAKAQLGKPYSWGAAGPNSFDCSGLTLWAWRAGGVSLPHYTGAQYGATRHVSISDLQPGDLVFYNGMNHVGLYIGGGQIIHAPHSGDVVKISSLYYWDTSMVASRP